MASGPPTKKLKQSVLQFANSGVPKPPGKANLRGVACGVGSGFRMHTL